MILFKNSSSRPQFTILRNQELTWKMSILSESSSGDSLILSDNSHLLSIEQIRTLRLLFTMITGTLMMWSSSEISLLDPKYWFCRSVRLFLWWTTQILLIFSTSLQMTSSRWLQLSRFSMRSVSEECNFSLACINISIYQLWQHVDPLLHLDFVAWTSCSPCGRAAIGQRHPLKSTIDWQTEGRSVS